MTCCPYQTESANCSLETQFNLSLTRARLWSSATVKGAASGSASPLPYDSPLLILIRVRTLKKKRKNPTR